MFFDLCKTNWFFPLARFVYSDIAEIPNHLKMMKTQAKAGTKPKLPPENKAMM